MMELKAPLTDTPVQVACCPSLNDVADEIFGCRAAFDGMVTLLSCSNSDKVDIELLIQWLKTFGLRLNLCEKMIQRVTDDYYDHTCC